MLERRAVPHDLLEIHLAADFILQVEFLLGKLVFEFGDLLVRQRVFNRDSNLTRSLAEEFDILWVNVSSVARASAMYPSARP